jgi:hypothetical protein
MPSGAVTRIVAPRCGFGMVGGLLWETMFQQPFRLVRHSAEGKPGKYRELTPYGQPLQGILLGIPWI